MTINLILSGGTGPGVVTSVADGGAVPVEPGLEVRLGGPATDGAAGRLIDLMDSEFAISGSDVVVRTADGQSITLLGYAEGLQEQALSRALSGAAAPEPQSAPGEAGMLAADWDRPLFPEPVVLGPKVSIDYFGDGGGHDAVLSRVDLFFEKAGEVSVEALFAALEVELGLRPAGDDAAPRIASLAVTDDPLALADLVGAGQGSEAGGAHVFGGLPALADAFGLLGVEDEPLPVNDNSFIINA